MFLRHKKLVLIGVIPVLFLLLVACGSIGNDSSNGNTRAGSTQQQGSIPAATAVATITPQQVTPKASGGSRGNGPVTIYSPTPVPGGKAGNSAANPSSMDFSAAAALREEASKIHMRLAKMIEQAA